MKLFNNAAIQAAKVNVRTFIGKARNASRPVQMLAVAGILIIVGVFLVILATAQHDKERVATTNTARQAADTQKQAADVEEAVLAATDDTTADEATEAITSTKKKSSDQQTVDPNDPHARLKESMLNRKKNLPKAPVDFSLSTTMVTIPFHQVGATASVTVVTLDSTTNVGWRVEATGGVKASIPMQFLNSQATITISAANVTAPGTYTVSVTSLAGVHTLKKTITVRVVDPRIESHVTNVIVDRAAGRVYVDFVVNRIDGHSEPISIIGAYTTPTPLAVISQGMTGAATGRVIFALPADVTGDIMGLSFQVMSASSWVSPSATFYL
jgi:hypothetical protein